MAEKYVVFKIDDWNAMWHAMREAAADRGDRTVSFADATRTMLEQAKVPDGVVIRRQDVFSGPFFAAYAHGIQLALKVAQLHEVGELNPTGERLRRIADYFMEQSELAYAESYKLPD